MRVSDSIAVGILLLLALQLQGCGRKGPLYLEQTPAAPVTPVMAAPVPASSPSAATPILPNSTETVKQP